MCIHFVGIYYFIKIDLQKNFEFNNMKRLTILLIALFALVTHYSEMSAQTKYLDVKVSEYGQLEKALGSDWDTVDSLVVHGPVDEKDFATMWKCSFEGRTTVLNLADAQVKDNKIPKRAFFNYDRQVTDDGVYYLELYRIILPETIEEIGDFAFARMYLQFINIPKNLKKFGLACFTSCHYLSTDPIVIPEGVVSISDECFMNCQCFKKVVLPSTIKEIGGAAFYNTRVAEINFPEGLETIDMGAFTGCDLEKVILPESLGELSESLFSMCPYLREVHVPEHTTEIPFNFASYCTELEKVNIPKGVVKIGCNAFSTALKLESFDLPEGLKYIGRDAFWYCSADTLVFPSTLEGLGGGSFTNCKYLKAIYSLASFPPLCEEDPANVGKGPFHGFTPEETPLYVPVGSGKLYREAFGWNYFKNIIETSDLPSGIECVVSGNYTYRVYAGEGGIVIDTPERENTPVRYAVYTFGGVEVESGVMSSRKVININESDIYIVRVGNETHKVRM